MQGHFVERVGVLVACVGGGEARAVGFEDAYFEPVAQERPRVDAGAKLVQPTKTGR